MWPCALIFLLFFCILPIIFVIFVLPRHPLNLGFTIYVFSWWKNNFLCTLLMFEPPLNLPLLTENTEELLLNGCADFPDKHTSVREGRQGLSEHEPSKIYLYLFILLLRRLHHQSRRQRLRKGFPFMCCRGCRAIQASTRTKDGQLPAINHIIAISISFAWLNLLLIAIRGSCYHIFLKCELVITFILSTITSVQGAVCVHSPQAHTLWWRIN